MSIVRFVIDNYLTERYNNTEISLSERIMIHSVRKSEFRFFSFTEFFGKAYSGSAEDRYNAL